MSSRATNEMPNRRCGAVERGGDHPLEREVGLDRRLVEVEAHLAHLLGVEAPVPRLDRAAFAARAAPAPRAPRARPRRARAPGATPAPAASVTAAWLRAIVSLSAIVGVARVAMQARLLVAQAEDLGARRRGCRSRRRCSPRDVHARQAASRRSRRSEKVRNGTISERDSVITAPSAMPRSRAASRAASRTNAGRPARSASSLQHQAERRSRRRARSGRSASSARRAAA